MKYNFCPSCGSETEQKEHNLFICKSCHKHFYINPAATTAVIIENAEDEILLVKRKFDPMKGFLDLPGGFIEINESVEEATVREITEELGVQILDIQYFISYPDDYFYEGVNVKVLGITLTGKIKGGEMITPSDDVEEAQFFRKDEIPLDKIAFKNIKQALLDYLNK